jgi:hypothetical protein
VSAEWLMALAGAVLFSLPQLAGRKGVWPRIRSFTLAFILFALLLRGCAMIAPKSHLDAEDASCFDRQGQHQC